MTARGGAVTRPGTPSRWRFKRIGLDTDDVAAIVEELASSPNPNVITRTRAGEWSTGAKPPACLDCRRTDRPHLARGLCGACYKAREKAGHGFDDRPPVKRGTSKLGTCYNGGGGSNMANAKGKQRPASEVMADVMAELEEKDEAPAPVVKDKPERPRTKRSKAKGRK